MAFDIDSIRLKFKNRKKRSASNPGAFLDFYEIALQILDTSELLRTYKSEYVPKRKIAQLLFNNFIVNTVTALELYFKTTISTNQTWEEEGYSFLLKEKITLNQAYDLFKKEKLTREYIVSHYFSFQNFLTVNSIFSKLIGTDFYSEVEKYELHWEDRKNRKRTTILQRDNPDWKRELQNLYEVRNKFVHEGTMTRFKEDEAYKLVFTVVDFQSAVNGYLHNRAISMKK